MLEETAARVGRVQVTRRQLLHGTGVITLAAVLRSTAAFGNDEPMGPFSDWSPPVNLGPIVNSPFNDRHPAISPNGLSLYITSDRPGGILQNGSSVFNLWVSQRASLDAPWGLPVNLGPNINTPVGFAPDISPEGTGFSSMGASIRDPPALEISAFPTVSTRMTISLGSPR